MPKCFAVFVVIFILKRMKNSLQILCKHIQVFLDVQSNTFVNLLFHILITALWHGPKARANRCRTPPKFLHEDENFFSFWSIYFKEFYTCREIILQTRLVPTCCTRFLLINYCSDVFRPQFLPIFRELILFCKLYINLLCRFITYTNKIVIKIE